MAIVGNEDHKQRVNLSSFAQTVIEFDRSVFDKGGSLSGFLNRIITAYRDSAEASVDLAAGEREQRLLLGGYAPEIVSRLVADYRKELVAKMESYPSGDSLTFRLNNQNFDLLYEQRAESTAYSAPSKYLKALLEEYVRLSPSERERVYYSSVVQQLEAAMESGCLLEIKSGGRQYFVKPYNVMADRFNSHLYLVGFSKQTDKPTDQLSIASFRISRLEQVKQKKHSGKLSVDEKRMVEKQLHQVGVQYLVGSSDQIQVRLTPEGREAFLQRSYMRPMPEKIEGDVYYFNCTQMQIRNYFISFGKDAKILKPESLQETFAHIYREAAEAYGSNLQEYSSSTSGK